MVDPTQKKKTEIIYGSIYYVVSTGSAWKLSGCPGRPKPNPEYPWQRERIKQGWIDM